MPWARCQAVWSHTALYRVIVVVIGLNPTFYMLAVIIGVIDQPAQYSC